jgi:hypothetical protein
MRWAGKSPVILRNGACAARRQFWAKTGKPVDNGEACYRIVMSTGLRICGRGFYRRQAGSSARILILDNHDDLRGHVKIANSDTAAANADQELI